MKRMIAVNDLLHGSTFVKANSPFLASDTDRAYYLEQGQARDDAEEELPAKNRMMPEAEPMPVTTPERPRRGRPRKAVEPKPADQEESAEPPADEPPQAEPAEDKPQNFVMGTGALGT